MHALLIAAMLAVSQPSPSDIDVALGWVHTEEYSPGRGAHGMLTWPAEEFITMQTAGNGPLNFAVNITRNVMVSGCADVRVEVSRMYEDQPHTTPDAMWEGRLCRM